MYIRNLRLRNVKCFEDITVSFRFRGVEDDPQHNWNVILGANGDGKTTLLQSMAACLTDAATAGRLLKTDNWVRKDCPRARMTADFVQEENDLSDIRPEAFRREFGIQYVVVNAGEKLVLSSDGSEKYFRTPAILEPMPDYKNEFEDYENAVRDFRYFSSHLSGQWIGCGYGPFRRISGASKYAENVTESGKPFQTLFDEGAALTDCEAWLRELHRLTLLDSRTDSEDNCGDMLDNILKFIQNILPNIDKVTIGKGIKFLCRGRQADLNELSDGYRSMFALIADLLRWLVDSDKDCSHIQSGSVSSEGIVLIDEIDAHLHPVWQREIGFLLTKIFPNIQFVVTTHSPFVAMAAGRGALTILETFQNSIIARQDIPYPRDWAAERVLADMFGVSGHSWETEKDLREYESLRFRQQAEPLDHIRQKRLARLEADLNKRLTNDKDSPFQRSMAADLAHLKSLIRRNQV